MIKPRGFVALLAMMPLCGQAENRLAPLDASLSDVRHTEWLVGPRAVTAEERIKRTEQLARRWEVSPEEWTRYETIMSGEGRFHWKDVDPIMVLGIYARNTQERERYAAMMAKKEHRLQSQFITFNQSYMAAFDELYGGQPIIDLAAFYKHYREAGLTASIRDVNQQPVSLSENTFGDRYVLFIDTQCERCGDWFSRIRTQQALGSTLDVYFIGESQDSISRWAKNQALEPVEIQDGTITLNQDNGMYVQYGRPALPAAYYYDESSQSTLQIREESAP